MLEPRGREDIYFILYAVLLRISRIEPNPQHSELRHSKIWDIVIWEEQLVNRGYNGKSRLRGPLSVLRYSCIQPSTIGPDKQNVSLKTFFCNLGPQSPATTGLYSFHVLTTSAFLANHGTSRLYKYHILAICFRSSNHAFTGIGSCQILCLFLHLRHHWHNTKIRVPVLRRRRYGIFNT